MPREIKIRNAEQRGCGAGGSRNNLDSCVGVDSRGLEATQRREVGAMGLSFRPCSCSFDWCAWQCLAACMSGAFLRATARSRAEQENKATLQVLAEATRWLAKSGFDATIRVGSETGAHRQESGTGRRSVPLLASGARLGLAGRGIGQWPNSAWLAWVQSAKQAPLCSVTELRGREKR